MVLTCILYLLQEKGVSSHWEERIFSSDEAMTHSNCHKDCHEHGDVSRITLALFEDSGWYLPNYDMVCLLI